MEKLILKALEILNFFNVIIGIKNKLKYNTNYLYLFTLPQGSNRESDWKRSPLLHECWPEFEPGIKGFMRGGISVVRRLMWWQQGLGF